MTKRRYITIHDIAREAGVSPSTVSRVLNGTTPVADHKRDAIMSAVETLNYRPNVVAQGLARGKSSTIGVLTQNMVSMFYGQILSGIEEGLVGSVYHPIFASGNWRVEEETSAFDLLIARRVDGIIVLGGQLPDELLCEIAEEIPLLAVGRTISGLENHCIQVENFQGGYEATNHLIELGHRRIAHITGVSTHLDSIARRNGYCAALLHAGLEIDPELIIEGNFQEISGLQAIQTLLARNIPFSAIFVANDQMAYGVYLGLYHNNIRIPKDISIVGFDDQPVSPYTTPPLTTVIQPSVEIGIAAAQTILRMMDGEKPVLPSFSTRLIVRESTAPFGGSKE